MEERYSFKKYTPKFSDKEIAKQIYQDIMRLNPQDMTIIIDMTGLIAMTTICARVIFGKLYVELGAETFTKNIIFEGLSDEIDTIIKWGIQKELEYNSLSA